MKQDSRLAFRKGGYIARFAEGAADIAAAQRLRHVCFIDRAGAAPRPDGMEQDPFDAICHHVVIEDVRTGLLVCCFRLLPLGSGADIGASYAAQYYDLTRLRAFPGPMVEIGRFCIHPDHAQDADVLRVAWGALTQFVDANGVALLFGCSSFPGTDASSHMDAFAMLHHRHRAPAQWSPTVKATEVLRFRGGLKNETPDMRRAILTMPPLLRTYLSMGGWVSDHAVIDHDLNTMHVFTGLEIAAVPAARARALRSMVG